MSTAVGVAGWSLARAQQPGANQPGTQWSEAPLGEAVDLARVGRKLTPKSWPNGSRVAVCLSFDADSEAMLDRHQIPATFFITAFATAADIARHVKVSNP